METSLRHRLVPHLLPKPIYVEWHQELTGQARPWSSSLKTPGATAAGTVTRPRQRETRWGTAGARSNLPCLGQEQTILHNGFSAAPVLSLPGSAPSGG